MQVLDTLLQQASVQIILKLFALQSNPIAQDCNQLQGCSNGYRVDQGEYITLYTFEARELQVFKISKRIHTPTKSSDSLG